MEGEFIEGLTGAIKWEGEGKTGDSLGVLSRWGHNGEHGDQASLCPERGAGLLV